MGGAANPVANVVADRGADPGAVSAAHTDTIGVTGARAHPCAVPCAVARAVTGTGIVTVAVPHPGAYGGAGPGSRGPRR